jgi:hypothetical protein
MEPNCGIRIHHGAFSRYCPIVRWMLRYCGQAANLSRLEVWRFRLYVVTVRIVNAVVITMHLTPFARISPFLPICLAPRNVASYAKPFRSKTSQSLHSATLVRGGEGRPSHLPSRNFGYCQPFRSYACTFESLPLYLLRRVDSTE